MVVLRLLGVAEVCVFASNFETSQQQTNSKNPLNLKPNTRSVLSVCGSEIASGNLIH
jgi:hypothetical protein